MNLKSADEILTFWFGSADPAGEPAADMMGKWFKEDFAFDAEIVHNFLDMANAARFSRLASWEAAPNSCLALILLLDQFPRNIYRGTAEAFMADSLALRISLNAIKSGLHKSVHVLRRQFFFLPLMHTEDLGIQNFCVRLYDELLPNAPMQYQEQLRESRQHAGMHRKLIEQFGRFPSRNSLMERDSTDAELTYLEELSPI